MTAELIGYVPYSNDLSEPGDRRRFPYYASHKGLFWEVAKDDRHYDVVILSAKADIAQWRRVQTPGTKVVYELVDSQLALSRRSLRWPVIGLGKYITHELSRPILDYRRSIIAMCSRADAIVCSTDEQKKQLLQYSRNVHVILDVYDELGNVRKSDYAIGSRIKLVWDGLPYTVNQLSVMQPAIERLSQKYELEVHVLTSPTIPRLGADLFPRPAQRVLDKVLPNAIWHDWSVDTMPLITTACDIAVIPLRLDDPMARGKPENKLLIFWRLAMPVVTSASPAYKRAMTNAGLDLTCENWQDWYWKLGELIENEQLRQRSAALGKQYYEARHSTRRVMEQWDSVLASVGVCLE